MDLIRLYTWALGMLAAERGLSIILALATVAIGVVQLAEPISLRPGRQHPIARRGSISVYRAVGPAWPVRASSPELPWLSSPTGSPIAVTSPQPGRLHF